MAAAPKTLTHQLAAPLKTTPRVGRVAAPRPPLRLGATRRVALRAKSTDTDTDTKSKAQEDIQEQFNEFVEEYQKKWEETDEKLAVVAIGLSAFVGLWAINGVASSLESLPFVGGLLELVGIFVTGWFAYRYLVFGPDREELRENIDDFFKKITGQ